ncbi:MAG: hypothetical protein E7384_01090 [Ruminococcaceae bacterium]|nr:hypothetical protein [Oscillospiraceae bacterium]
MGCLFEVLGEIFIEVIGTVFLEVFVGFAEFFIPEKLQGKKAETVIRIIFGIMGILVFFALIFGVLFLIDSIKNFWGWLLILVSVSYIAIAIVACYIRNKKTEARTMKDKVLKTIALLSPLVIFIVLLVIYAIVPSFAIKVILHTYLRLWGVAFSLYVLNKMLRHWIPNSRKIVLVISGVAIGIDYVLVDAVRFVLSSGKSTVLFLPVCLPIFLMAFLHYSFKENNCGTRAKVITFVIGIPLLLLSLYFEILSFIDM